MVDALTSGNQYGVSSSQASRRLLPCPFRCFTREPAHTSPSGAMQIAFGLAILISFAWFPLAPVVTAMAIIALGATNATLARFQGSPALCPVLLLHAVTYLSLYAPPHWRHAARGRSRFHGRPGRRPVARPGRQPSSHGRRFAANGWHFLSPRWVSMSGGV